MDGFQEANIFGIYFLTVVGSISASSFRIDATSENKGWPSPATE